MPNKKTDITKPIGLFLGALLLTLGLCSSKADAKDNKYELVIENIIGQDIEFKPKKVKFHGYNDIKMSVGSKWRNGGMALIKGAEDVAYNGNEFWSVAVDHSKCKVMDYHNDCKHHNGSSRVEYVPKSWTFTEGTEKWINYAFLPANNVLFENNSARKFHIGQCHPSGDTINWMITLQRGNLEVSQAFKSVQHNDGTWHKDGIWPSHKIIKKFKANKHNGSMDWTNVRINFKNTKNPDGKLKIWIDGELKYDYEGPTNWGDNQSRKCKFKIGLYTNANNFAVNKDKAENMIVFLDYMAIAKTESKLEKLLKKDK